MEFVQTIELTTTKYDELRAVGDEFIEKRRSAGGAKPTSVVHLRDNPNTYRIVAWFASAEEAMENSNRDDTTQMAERMGRCATSGRSGTSTSSTRSTAGRAYHQRQALWWSPDAEACRSRGCRGLFPGAPPRS